jgi:hypothetical protein
MAPYKLLRRGYATGGRFASLALLFMLAIVGCARHPQSLLVPNLLPELQLTAAPRPESETKYSVRLAWSAFDPDGQVKRFDYVVDPPTEGDTLWTATTVHELNLELPATRPDDPLAPIGIRVLERTAHTFSIVAVDDQGGRSPVVTRSFTARTVAPETAIDNPSPTRLQAVKTLPQVVIRWHGVDFDGTGQTTPVLYKYKFILANAIDANPEIAVNPTRIQGYFGADFANGFADWDSLPGDVTSFQARGLTPGTLYLFAIVARDEAGAYEPRFLLDSNVLQFRPTLQNLGPSITVQNEFFNRKQTTGGISLDPARFVTLEIPANEAVHFTWFAQPNTGSAIGGYRWVLDVPDGLITNETPRTDDADVHHWSSWSLGETSAMVGPFAGSTDSTVTHFLFIEARDQVGFVSLFTLRLRVVSARLDKPLLLIDDLQGTLSNGPFPYPTEAEQDSFYCAVGNVPDRLTGQLSIPGAFSEFVFDTLDTQFFGRNGIPLSTLGRYKVVAIYLDHRSATFATDRKPGSALLFLNSVGQLNTLAVYLRQGGKAFVFGEGAPAAIGVGYATRQGTFQIPTPPYTSTAPVRSRVLVPGCFLYDFMYLRSEINTAGTTSTQFTLGEQLVGSIPYLPAFRGPASNTDRSHDPRIGPSAERNVAQWSELPRLTVAPYRGAVADPLKRSINQTWYISRPLTIVEGPADVPVLDTLYLLQSRDYSGDGIGALADALPNAVCYHGSESSEIVWLGFPLYYFEPDQARQLVRVVLRNLGLSPRTPS